MERRGTPRERDSPVSGSSVLSSMAQAKLKPEHEID